MMLGTLPWEDTVRVSRDWAMMAIQTLAKLPREQAKPLRFISMSAHFAPRERIEQIKVLGDNNMIEYGFLRVSGCSTDKMLPCHIANLFLTFSRERLSP